MTDDTLPALVGGPPIYKTDELIETGRRAHAALIRENQRLNFGLTFNRTLVGDLADELARAMAQIEDLEAEADRRAAPYLATAASALRDALDTGDMDMLLAASFGAARFAKMDAPITRDAAPMAVLRDTLTAIVNSDDASLDDLRACNQAARDSVDNTCPCCGGSGLYGDACVRAMDGTAPATCRWETDMEHIGRDMAEGRFPERSERRRIEAPKNADLREIVARAILKARFYDGEPEVYQGLNDFFACVWGDHGDDALLEADAALAAMEGRANG